MEKSRKEKLKDLIDRIDAKIVYYEQKLNEKSEAFSEDFKERIKELKSRKSELKEDFEDIKNYSEDRFKEMKEDLENKLHDLNDVYHYLKAKWSKN